MISHFDPLKSHLYSKALGKIEVLSELATHIQEVHHEIQQQEDKESHPERVGYLQAVEDIQLKIWEIEIAITKGKSEEGGQ